MLSLSHASEWRNFILDGMAWVYRAFMNRRDVRHGPHPLFPDTASIKISRVTEPLVYRRVTHF